MLNDSSSDTVQAARANIVEGGRYMIDTLEWLAGKARNPDGSLTVDACEMGALAAHVATVVGLVESFNHPCHTAHLVECADGSESAVIMLRAVHALRVGDRGRADELARLAASMWNKEER